MSMDDDLDRLVGAAMRVTDDEVRGWDLADAEDELVGNIMREGDGQQQQGRRWPRLPAVSVAAAVVVAVGAAGLFVVISPDDSADPPVASPSETNPEAPDRVPEAVVVSPLDALRLTDTQDQVVWETWQAGMAACMTAAGFEFTIPDYEAVSATSGLPTDEASIRQYGYNVPEQSLPESVTAFDTLVQNDPAVRAAFLGDENDATDGCRGEAYVRTFGTSDDSFNQLDGVLASAGVDIDEEARASDAVATADTAWSQCMHERGFEYNLWTDPLSALVDDEITDLEVETRLADVACQETVDYARVVANETARREQAWIDENPTIVQEYLAAKDAHLAALNYYRAELGL